MLLPNVALQLLNGCLELGCLAVCCNPRGTRAEEKEDRRKKQAKSGQGAEEKGKGKSCEEKAEE